jgi:hypothetical protein
MPTFRFEIQEFIDTLTVGLEGETPAARGERILTEAFDVIGKSLKSIDEENREEDLLALQEELEAASLIVVGRVFKDRPFIGRGVKAALPFIIDAAIQYVTDNSGTVLEFSEDVIKPVFSRLRRIAEQGEAAFSVQV